MSNMGSSTHYEPTGETTEWQDILVKKGIIEPPPKVEKKITYIADRVDRNDDAHGQKGKIDLLNADEDDLDEFEDELDDNIFLQKFRDQRIAEMKAQASLNKFGSVGLIEKVDWVREVTEASKNVWVVAFLFQDHVPECAAMDAVLNELAPKHAYVKILKIKSTSAIENWPDQNLPTLFMYHDGELTHQLLGLSKVGGKRMTADHLEWHLAQLGVLKTNLQERPAVESPNRVEVRRNFVSRSAKTDILDEDD